MYLQAKFHLTQLTQRVDSAVAYINAVTRWSCAHLILLVTSNATIRTWNLHTLDSTLGLWSTELVTEKPDNRTVKIACVWLRFSRILAHVCLNNFSLGLAPCLSNTFGATSNKFFFKISSSTELFLFRDSSLISLLLNSPLILPLISSSLTSLTINWKR